MTFSLSSVWTDMIVYLLTVRVMARELVVISYDCSDVGSHVRSEGNVTNRLDLGTNVVGQQD